MNLRISLFLVATCAAVACAAACSSDDEGEGSAGSGEGGDGATGNVGNQGGAGAAGSGTGGGPDCHNCLAGWECLQDPSGEGCELPICGTGNDVFDELAVCVCTECSEECAMACDGGDPEPGCDVCQDAATAAGAACEMALDDCANDA